MEALKIVKLFKDISSFDQRCSFHDEITYSVIEGHEDAVEIALALKVMIDIAEATLKDISSYVVTDVNKAGGKYEALGCKLEVKEAGVKNDFSSTNDWQLSSISSMVDKYSSQLKERQKFLQSLPPDGMETINEDTGEVVRLLPPRRTSSTIVAITLPKGGKS